VIDSPLLNEIVAEKFAPAAHKMILGVLTDRLGDVPADVEAAVRAIQDEERLDRANRLAARAADYPTFRRDLAARPAPPPDKPRRRRRR
jgi:hypothetical protein